jgi:photosystem II stability/assembly factor-like uncharacterized protein
MKKIFAILLSLSCLSYSQTGWYQQNSNTNNDIRSVFFLDSNKGYACGSGFLKTTNSGTNWNSIDSIFGSLYSISFADYNTGYIVGGDSFGTYIYKTSNSGLNWFSQNSNSFNTLYSLCIVSQTGGNVVYCVGANGSMIKTTNGGTNWYLLTSGINTNLYSVYFLDVNTGFAVGDIHTILKTTDAGLDWINISQPEPDYITYYAILFVNNSIGYISVTYNNFPRTVLKTTNGGINWFGPGPGNGGGYSISFPNQNIGYSVGNGGYISKTTNGGNNWYQQNSGITKALRSIFFVNQTMGWAVGDSGIILKTTDGGGPPIGIKPISNNVPEKFVLYQNYPNPFNPSSKIKFQIAKLSDVQLKIYDILGREVATLANEKFQPGVYEVEFDGNNYPSGVYFYQLTTESFSNTKRMVLLK